MDPSILWVVRNIGRMFSVMSETSPEDVRAAYALAEEARDLLHENGLCLCQCPPQQLAVALLGMAAAVVLASLEGSQAEVQRSLN